MVCARELRAAWVLIMAGRDKVRVIQHSKHSWVRVLATFQGGGVTSALPNLIPIRIEGAQETPFQKCFFAVLII